MRRVVITGLGIFSVLGDSEESVAKALYEGKSGIVLEPQRKKHGLHSALTGKLIGKIPDDLFSKKERQCMTPFAQQACMAAITAVGSADIRPRDIATDRAGIIFGNDSSILAAQEQAKALSKAGTTAGMGSGHVFRGMNSTISMHLNVILGNLGPSLTVSSACASGAFAIAMAFDQIRLGRMDMAVVGGAQELNWQSVAALEALNACSSNPDPEQASRPFDKDRDGLVPSGGAAALFLEDYESAKKRNVPILAEILGYGASSDGNTLFKPKSEGLARSMRMAIKEADFCGSLDLVSAHGTSTILGDAAEAESLREVFGTCTPPVTAFKSYTGHELWMSGASQLVYTICMARAGFTAPCKNFVEPDKNTAGIPILTKRLDVPPKLVLHNAAGFGGTSISMVVRYYP
ncbi:MAG: beta-ketoacyl-[acyl-carrier-protein] synthase family protein [Desulfovibrio sp.]|nr:beta-ketoacyl-[acyl-carrier-protein] synthase family protein [Desulfovibrio sp.]